MNLDIWYRRGCKCGICRDKRAAKPRVRGPLVGGLWKCYTTHDGGMYRLKIATGMNPEEAYNNWLSFAGREA